MGSRQPWQLGPACRLTRLAISCSHRTPAAILVVVKPQRGRSCCDVVVDSAARLRRAGIARGEPDDPRHIGVSRLPAVLTCPGSRSSPGSASRCRQHSVSASWLWCASSMSASLIRPTSRCRASPCVNPGRTRLTPGSCRDSGFVIRLMTRWPISRSAEPDERSS